MGTKKSLFFSVGLFVIIVWIWGFATPALSETLKCKTEMKQVVRADEQVYSGYFIGVNTREGSATCENGETATVNSYAVWDQIWHKACFKEGYTIFTFKDFSKMIMKNKLTQIPDPKGEAEWIWDGTAEIIKGTIQFNGIKGSASFKGKQLFPDKKSINEWTITFTVPPK